MSGALHYLNHLSRLVPAPPPYEGVMTAGDNGTLQGFNRVAVLGSINPDTPHRGYQIMRLNRIIPANFFEFALEGADIPNTAETFTSLVVGSFSSFDRASASYQSTISQTIWTWTFTQPIVSGQDYPVTIT